jgi:hypothetical protein
MRVNKRKADIIALLFVASLLVVLPIQMVKAQTTTVSVAPQNSTVSIGKTVIVTIQLSNVQNLYGLDVTLDYNNTVLQLTNEQPDLGTLAIPGGVLYGNPVTTDINSLQSGGLYYNTSLSTPSEYHLFSFSAGTAPSFNGSGTIVTLTFRVIGAGKSPLTLSSNLSDHPAPTETSSPIPHNDVSGTVDVTSSSSSSPTPSSSPSSSPSSPSPSASSSPSATSPSHPKSPAFPVLLAIIAVVIVVLVALAVLLSRRRTKKASS